MDKYEELLEEKIANAKADYNSLLIDDEFNKDSKFIGDVLKRITLLGQINTYRDALITYRNIKAKGKIIQ